LLDVIFRLELLHVRDSLVFKHKKRLVILLPSKSDIFTCYKNVEEIIWNFTDVLLQSDNCFGAEPYENLAPLE
jgi:hypothetical protein